MSTIKNNSMVKGASGMFSDDIVYRRVRGKTVLAKAPTMDENREPTEDELARRERFLKAVKFANRVQKNPVLLAEYEAGITENKFTARLVAMSDYFNAPKVKQIDTFNYRGQVDDVIIIDATDDFMVDEVSVIITSGLGAELERGLATRDPEDVDLWIYKATVANNSLPGTKITVAAKDRPRNVTTKETVL